MFFFLQSSIVVTGVPTKNYRLPTGWIQPNSTVVNVASFKNVDEEELLKIPGVVYVPMVGKVTVAMLERNLMRLYEQFHSPTARRHEQGVYGGEPISPKWKMLQIYTAIVVTAMLAVQVMKK